MVRQERRVLAHPRTTSSRVCKVRELLDPRRPFYLSSTREGQITLNVGGVVYEYWLDAALHEWVKKSIVKQPWKTLNFVKSRCWNWRAHGT